MVYKVAIIGTGNWGTTLAKIIAESVLKNVIFKNEVMLWGIPEQYNGESLKDIINKEHINKKYLNNVILPKNIVCTNDLEDIYDSDIFVFCLPHQFIDSLNSLKGKIKKTSIGLSVSKGLIYKENEIILISSYIEKILEINVSVLMGANIAKEIADGKIAEGTIGYDNLSNFQLLKQMFSNKKYFVTGINDKVGPELCGALKNIVAIAYGISKGLDIGCNGEMIFFRYGLVEIKRFIDYFFPKSSSNCLFESCGIPDLLVSCLNGRNANFGKSLVTDGCTIEEYEESMGGQKLQGPGTSKEIYEFIFSRNRIQDFKLFSAIYSICYENENPKKILDCLNSSQNEKN